MATGVTTLDFGTTPTDEATILVTGLSGLSVGTHKEAFVQGDDSTADNDATAHQFLAWAGQFNAQYVSATTMNINCKLMAGLATKTFTVHYATV
jgi:hypothetical protein